MTGYRIGRRGVERGFVLDVALWAVPLGIVCARFYHVFTHVSDYFYPARTSGTCSPSGTAATRSTARCWAVLSASTSPVVAPASASGRSRTRWRRAFWSPVARTSRQLVQPRALRTAHDTAVGAGDRSTNAKFPPGLPPGTLFHPLFLYEIVWNLTGVVIILLLERRFRLQWGKTLAVYLVWYGLGRSWLESIRIDPTSDGWLGIPRTSGHPSCALRRESCCSSCSRGGIPSPSPLRSPARPR